MADVPVNPSDASTVVVVTSNGQVAFDYDFRADKVEDLKAIYKAADGTETLLVGGVNFIASGLETASGGTVALTTFTATVAGDTLTIYRDIEISRTTDYSRDLFAEDLNAEQDRIFMILQEQKRDVDRAAKVGIGEDPIDITPGAPGEMLFFDADGNLIPGAPPVGVGNMNTAVYDPRGKGVDVFDSANIDYKASGLTTVTRSVSSRLRDRMSVKDFGAVGDGVADDTEALQAAFTASSEDGEALHIPAGIFSFDEGLEIPSSAMIYGDAFDADVNVGRDMRLSGTVLLARGSAPKNRYALGVTDDRTSGGRVANPDADFGATDAFFSLADYYNQDANSATGQSATPAAFSAALKFKFGSAGTVMKDIRLLLNFDGVNGYNNKTLTLADDWDVGIYADNSRYCQLSNVQVLGYWRKNGLLIRSGALGREETENGFYAGAEENKFYNCVFQGWKSMGLRSPGMFRVMAITSTYIEVPWADNHPFDIHITPSITAFEFAPRWITITGVSKVGSNLRLMTETDQTAFVSVGTEVAPGFIGNGVAGTVFKDCRFHGMWHSSGRRISDPAISGAMAPSACVEISGTRIRGPRFEGCKMQTVDDIGAQLHQCIDVILGPNARFEGSTPSANGPGGIRMISTPSDAVAYPGRVRETFRVQLHAEQPGADFTPSFGERGAKFTTDGFWVPNVCGEIFQGGIYVGPYNENTLLREYLVGGFTPVLSFANNGDLAVASQTRAGSVEYCGEWLRFNIRHTARLTWATASGRLQVALPRTVFNQANLLPTFECSFDGVTLPAGRTQLHAEGQVGTALAHFVASGSGVSRAYIDDTHLVSGAFVTFTISGMYRFQR